MIGPPEISRSKAGTIIRCYAGELAVRAFRPSCTRRPSEGYAVCQKKRKLVEEPFGWGKVIGGLARPMRRGTAHIGFTFTFVMAAYDLVRLPKLLGGYANALAGGAPA